MAITGSKQWQLFLVALLLLVGLPIQAKETEPFTLSIITGSAHIIAANGEKRLAKNGEAIAEGETVKVGSNSRASVNQANALDMVLDQDTELEIQQGGVFSQITGMVYYWFSKSKAAKTVKANGTTIGIRGTEFLIKSNDSAYELTLAEGKVDITADKAAFAHYKAQILSEFEAYKRQQLQEFEAYKQPQQEFIGLRKTISVSPRTTITIDSQQRLVEQAALQSAMQKLQALKRSVKRQ